MALTLYYVDPAAGVDTPAGGTIGAPWLTTQYALNHITQGAGGDQINIKAGLDDVLSAALSLSTYGTPTFTKPLDFRGYTAVANDGGIGGVNGNNSNGIISSASAYISCKDLHLHNCGSANII